MGGHVLKEGQYRYGWDEVLKVKVPVDDNGRPLLHALHDKSLEGPPGEYPVASKANSLWRTWETGPNGAMAGATTVSYKHRHFANVDARYIRLVFANWKVSSDQPGANAITIEANVLTPLNYVLEVYFNGKRTVEIPPGGQVISDPIGIGLLADDRFFTIVSLTVPAGGTYLLGSDCKSAFEEGWANGNAVTGGIGITNADTPGSYHPIAIVGQPTKGTDRRGILFVGDSITAGHSASVDFGGDSFAHRVGRQHRVGVLIAGASGSLMQQLTSHSNVQRRFGLGQWCTDAVVFMGTNDYENGNRSFAQLKVSATAVFNDLRRLGLRVYAATMLPRTLDLTARPQFTPGPNSARGQHNAWIRNRADGLIHDYIEFADAVETGRDTNQWQPNHTVDGTHPQPVAIAKLVAAVRAKL